MSCRRSKPLPKEIDEWEFKGTVSRLNCGGGFCSHGHLDPRRNLLD
jgi:hypothetical protein